MFLKNKLVFIVLVVLSCQPVEVLKPVNIDYSIFEKISINAKDIEIIKKYNSVFSKNNIEYQIQNRPIDVIVDWHKKNINKIGDENKLVINIIDSSISKNEINNEDAKNYEEKTIFKYEIFYLVEYELYDNSGFLIANTTVENSRTTTSKKYISLNETELIINELLILTIVDFVKEAKNQLSNYMSGYITN